MALDMPYDTKITTLHKLADIPTIEEFIEKNADRFYSNASSNDNDLIRPLGNYTNLTLPFRLKHSLPRKMS